MDEEFYGVHCLKLSLTSKKDRQETMKKRSTILSSVGRAPTGGKDHFAFEEVSGRSKKLQ